MAVKIGDVTTIPQWEQATKEQSVKILEEASEVREAFADWDKRAENSLTTPSAEKVVDECADLITATCDLLAGLGVTDMTDALQRCVERNKARGRL